MKKPAILLLALIYAPFLASPQGFYQISQVNTIEIIFPQSNWDYLLDSLVVNGQEERLPGSVIINGEQYDSVGVRYKGNSSYDPQRIKNPLNIKLDYIIDDQEIEGYGTLKLANGFKDPSFLREALGYEIARKYMPAGLSNYADVYINGTHMGLYTSDQDVDKYFMRTHFGSDENARIKGEIGDNTLPGQMGGVWEYFGEDSTLYFNRYVLESDFGWTRLISFLDTLNNYPASADQVLNIDRQLWMIAFDFALVNLDSPVNVPQNYYLYQDDAGRFNPIPWDLNECFGGFNNLTGYGPQNNQQLMNLSPFTNISSPSLPGLSKILSQERYRKMYTAHMTTILEENFISNLYYERALEIQNIIDGYVQADPNKFYTYNDFLTNLNSTAGSGAPPMGGIVGIRELMDARISYLYSLPDFQHEAPVITDPGFTPSHVTPGSEVWFTVSGTGISHMFLGYRTENWPAFSLAEMYDDGNHMDGNAGDGIFGRSVQAGNTTIEYYFYAENDNAGSFLPVRAEYEYFSLPVTGDLVINEFMADNESTVTDQDGEYDDWIELYNNGSQTINLNGMYLTDDPSEPDQWIFPDTTLAPGNFLIVWADDDTGQAGLHANFKLSADGETILLSDTSLNTLDEVVFGPQYPDTTTGRYPNGTGLFLEMLPTFGAMNSPGILGISDPVNQGTTDYLRQNYPNPFSEFTNIPIYLTNKNKVTLEVFSLEGFRVLSITDLHPEEKEQILNINTYNWHPGIYIVILTTDSTRLTRKMIKIHK